MKSLFSRDLEGVNVGLSSFADNITAAGGTATQLDWAPPAGADAELGWTLATLIGDPRVEQANRTAYDRYLAAQPRLVDVVLARDAIPALTERRILHSGPPIGWDDMCGPQRGAIAGAIRYEGWADDLPAAEAPAASGGIALEPCHEYGALGPMAGIISPSMPVWVVENAAADNRAFSNLNEGLGKVLRYGANSDDVLDRLRWLGGEFHTVLQTAVRAMADHDLKPLMAQAVHMGDERHNRNAAAGVAGSSLVTVMARNGVNFGIRLSGTGDRWFEAPANPVDGLYFPGYSVDDTAAGLGDSAITETNGIGGFAMAASPAIVQFVGGTPADATANSRRMLGITLGANPAFTLPQLNFGGTPAGIDARSVVDSGVLPIINTGIAHKQAGVGQIGAGITTAPMACFEGAVTALAGELR